MRTILVERWKTIRLAWNQKWRCVGRLYVLLSFIDFLCARVLSSTADDWFSRILRMIFGVIPWPWWIVIGIGIFSLMLLEYATKQRLLVSEQYKQIQSLPSPPLPQCSYCGEQAVRVIDPHMDHLNGKPLKTKQCNHCRKSWQEYD